MQLATRWLGAGSIVVGVVAAAALAVSLIPREPERLSWEDAHWREYTWMLYSSCEEGDVRYEHSLRQIGECLSRSSGWAHFERGPQNIFSVTIEEHTPLQLCLEDKDLHGKLLCGGNDSWGYVPQQGWQRRPGSLVYHRAEDFQALVK